LRACWKPITIATCLRISTNNTGHSAISACAPVACAHARRPSETLRPQGAAERWHTSVALTWHSKCEWYQGTNMLILKQHGVFIGLDQHGRRGMHKNHQSKGGASSKTSASVQRELRDRDQPETTARAWPSPRGPGPRHFRAIAYSWLAQTWRSTGLSGKRSLIAGRGRSEWGTREGRSDSKVDFIDRVSVTSYQGR